MRLTARILTLFLVLAVSGWAAPAPAAPPDGTLAIGVHVTLVSRWLDPGETEALITPFMVLYPLHDALVKPMPGKIIAPSLAESWTLAKDGVTYEFVLRKNAKFHNGDPVTAEDVKFTFERYKGSGAKLLKDKVKEIQTAGAEPRAHRPEGAVARLHRLLRHLRHRRGLDRAEEVHREGGRGRVQEGAGGRGARSSSPSFKPGIELTLEAFPDYWRKAPQVKRLVMRSIPDETTRAAAVKTGEVDLAYLFGGAIADDLKRTPGIKVVAPLLYGVYWLDFLDQWDPKSPWHDRRVRQAASLAIDRNAHQPGRDARARQGHRRLRAAGVRLRAQDRRRPPSIPRAPSSSSPRPAIPNGFDAGDLTPLPPYTSLGETVGELAPGASASARRCARWSGPPS